MGWRASERLGRTPSTISLQMKRLQDETGVQLFRKQGRNTIIIEQGEIALQYARRVLELSDEMIDVPRGSSLSDVVRIGFASLLVSDKGPGSPTECWAFLVVSDDKPQLAWAVAAVSAGLRLTAQALIGIPEGVQDHRPEIAAAGRHSCCLTPQAESPYTERNAV